jgi:type I restriction enzyme S subunit
VSKWRETTIADIAAPSRNALVGGPFGSNLGSRDYTPSGVPVIRGQNMGFGRWVSGEFVFVSKDKAEDLSANIARPGDLVFTQRGTLGQVAIVPPASFDRYIVSQSQMKLTVDPAKADAKFLFYFFTSEEQQEYIRQNAIQTGVPHTNLGHLRNTPLFLPPLLEQRAIAAVLGSLDDKIELNRRMNETLEALAQSLFKSWFVDATQSALPKGWRETILSECCENIFSGGTPSTQAADYWGGDIPWLSSGETRSRFIIDTEKTITPFGVENSSTRPARAGSTVIASAGQGHTRGQTSFLTFDSYINQSVVVLVADKNISSDLFLFFDLARRYEQFRQMSDSQSSRGSLTTKLLGEMKVIVPPRELISKFDEAVAPMIKKIIANLKESRTLAALRDALLPKLLSGELRVPQNLANSETKAL